MSFIDEIQRYLYLPRTNEGLARAAVTAPRASMTARLAGTSNKKAKEWKSAQRQLQRWDAQFKQSGKQARDFNRMKPATRDKIERALLQDREPALADVQGLITISRDTRPRTFKVRPIFLRHLRAMLACAAAADRANNPPFSGEEYALNILTGIYFDEPPTDIEIDGEIVARAPWSEEFSYSGYEIYLMADRKR